MIRSPIFNVTAGDDPDGIVAVAQDVEYSPVVPEVHSTSANACVLPSYRYTRKLHPEFCPAALSMPEHFPLSVPPSVTLADKGLETKKMYCEPDARWKKHGGDDAVGINTSDVPDDGAVVSIRK